MPVAKAASRLLPLAWLLPLAVAIAALAWMVSVLAPPAPRPQLTIAVGPFIGYEPFVLAREMGWLGPRLRLVETLSNTETTQGLRDGSIGVAGVTLDEALRLRSDGVPVRVIAVLSDSRGADAVVLAPGVEGLAALRGQVVLVEASAVGFHILHTALASVGLDSSQVQVVQVQSALAPPRWRAGDAAGAVLYEPMLSELVAEGAVVAYSTADHPGLVLDVLVAREEVIRERGPELAEAMAAWDRAVQAFAEPERLPVEMLSMGVNLDAAGYRGALAGVLLFDAAASRRMMLGPEPELAAAARSVADSLRAAGLDADLRVDGKLLAPEVAGPP